MGKNKVHHYFVEVDVINKKHDFNEAGRNSNNFNGPFVHSSLKEKECG